MTTNDSSNGIKVRTKIYATAGRTIIPGSWRERVSHPNAYITSRARSPQSWGSGHTTTPTLDPVKWLYLQV